MTTNDNATAIAESTNVPPAGSYQATYQRRGQLGAVHPDSCLHPRPGAAPNLPGLDDAIQGETRNQYDALAERITSYRDAEADYDKYIEEISSGDFGALDSAADAEKARLDRGAMIKLRSRLLEDLAEFAPEPLPALRQLKDDLPSDASIQNRIAKGLNKLGFDLVRRSGDGPYVDAGNRPIAWNGAIRSHKDFVANVARREQLSTAMGQWSRYARDLRDALNRCDAEAREYRRAILAGL